MRNDRYPANGPDPLNEGVLWKTVAWWAMPPIFTHASQDLDRLASEEKRRATQDRPDERLARAAYLSIVGIERVVGAVGSCVLRVGRYVVHQVSLQRQDGCSTERTPTDAGIR